ncbi:translation initiation factor IF-2-like [Cervus elaphus]|uniref:translation initiation factor IF-2-like n=1 Tax=Cervus elaphus TaxID=9860 RepID=UPI001CC2DEE0|nr:translation initiation factor IF-2-like [Cervus elaphus]
MNVIQSGASRSKCDPSRGGLGGVRGGDQCPRMAPPRATQGTSSQHPETRRPSGAIAPGPGPRPEGWLPPGAKARSQRPLHPREDDLRDPGAAARDPSREASPATPRAHLRARRLAIAAALAPLLSLPSLRRDPPVRGPASASPPEVAGRGAPGRPRRPPRRPRPAPTHRGALPAVPSAGGSSCAAPRARLHLPLRRPPSLRGPAGGERGAAAKPGAGAGAGAWGATSRGRGGGRAGPSGSPRAGRARDHPAGGGSARARGPRSCGRGARTRRQPGSGREREGRCLLGEGGPFSFRTPSLPPTRLAPRRSGRPSPPWADSLTKTLQTALGRINPVIAVCAALGGADARPGESVYSSRAKVGKR